MKVKINTDIAPKAIGSYSQAVMVGSLLFVSGQIPLDINGNIVGNDITMQTRQVLDNLKNIIESAGMSISDVVTCTCFLKNMSDFVSFNDVYSEYFGSVLPARECIEVSKLPKDALVEVSAICATEA